MKVKTRSDYRKRRHQRVRKKVSGSAARPRMAIMRSGRHMYVQFIDDAAGATLASASTLGEKASNSVPRAEALGQRAAKAATDKGITSVVVDRGGFTFHGRVKAIVDMVVAGGVKVGSTKAPALESVEKEEGEAKA